MKNPFLKEIAQKELKKKEMCFYTFRHKKSEPKFAFFIDLKR